MKIKYYGHAAFKITTDKGVRIIIDPYEPGAFGGALSYGRISDEADIVLTSHDHGDHNYTKDIRGTFTHINKAGTQEVKNITIKAIPVYHDTLKGKERGNNLIFVINADGLVAVHSGDLGHALAKDTIRDIGNVDILMLPVGGVFTVDPQGATDVMNSIKPAITIPMHFKTEKSTFPLATVDEFISGKKAVKKLKGSEVEIKKETLPKEPEIIVLENAL